MQEAATPSISEVLEWLDRATVATIVAKGPRANHRKVIWSMLRSVFEPDAASAPSFDRARARWILSWVNYVTMGAKHPSRVQSAVLEVARGAKPDAVARALGRTRTTFSNQAMYEFKGRMADLVILGLERDFGIKPAEDGVSFAFAP